MEFNSHLGQDAEKNSVCEPASCTLCSARLRGICSALQIPELEELSHHTTQKRFAKGDIISFDDDHVSRFGNILSGTVKLSKILADGRQQIVGLQFAPEFVGRPYQDTAKITAEAASDVTLCLLPKKRAEGLLENSPDFMNFLFKQTLGQLDEAREWMVALGRKSASERLASFIVLLNRHIGEQSSASPDARLLKIPLNRHETSDFLGLTIETVSRQITRFRKAGLIDVIHNNEFLVPDIYQIEIMAGD